MNGCLGEYAVCMNGRFITNTRLSLSSALEELDDLIDYYLGKGCAVKLVKEGVYTIYKSLPCGDKKRYTYKITKTA